MTQRTGLNKSFGLDFAEHKQSHVDEKTAKDSLEVVGAGLPRCGTTSLKRALEILGFDPCHHMIDCIDYPERSRIFTSLISSQDNMNPSTFSDPSRLALLRKAMRGYKATVDAPCCDLYRELATVYPSAKVVLNTRDSAEAWWYSFENTLGPQTYWPYRILTFPIGFLREQNVLGRAIVGKWKDQGGGYGPEKYHQHLQEVKAWVPKGRLLEFNVKEGWEPLCKFLEVPVPKEPFPHLNDAKAIKGAVLGAQLLGACAYLVGFGAVAGAAWLAVAPPVFMQDLVARAWPF